MLFSPTLQRFQDMSLSSLTGGRLWRPKKVLCPPEASQHPYSGGSLTKRYPLESKYYPKQRQRCFRRPSRGFSILPLWSFTGGRLWRPKNVPCPPEASQHSYSEGSLTERYPLESKFCPKQRQCCFRRPSRGFRILSLWRVFWRAEWPRVCIDN